MDQKVLVLCLCTVLATILSSVDKTEAKKNEGECEVCISVLERFLQTVPSDDQSNKDKLEKHFIKFCKGTKGKDYKFCEALGATATSPTNILGMMTKPLSWSMPPQKVCEDKLRKADDMLCRLKYEKQIDLANTNLKKLRVSELKKILSAWGEDNACKGCAEKSDFIKEIEKLMPKYDPEAAKKRAEKTEL